MKFESIEFTGHAIQQMFSRKIAVDEVRDGVENGEIIKSYPDDRPYPSFLILHYINERPLHIVAAKEEARSKVHIITAYIPSLNIWKEDFRNRK